MSNQRTPVSLTERLSSATPGEQVSHESHYLLLPNWKTERKMGLYSYV